MTNHDVYWLLSEDGEPSTFQTVVSGSNASLLWMANKFAHVAIAQLTGYGYREYQTFSYGYEDGDVHICLVPVLITTIIHIPAISSSPLKFIKYSQYGIHFLFYFFF